MKNKLIFILLIFILILITINYKNTYEFFLNKKIHFLHIPKNAGTTFKSMYPEFNIQHWESQPVNNKINIAIIRNPYDRFISIFNHLKDRNINEKNSNDLSNFDNIMNLYEAYYDTKNINHKQARELLRWDKNEFIRYKNKLECDMIINKCIHWCPQYIFIDSYKVEYLIKFENLESDIIKIQNKGILKKIPIKKKRISPDIFKKKNKINNNIKKLVDEIYKKDFELWNKSGIN